MPPFTRCAPIQPPRGLGVGRRHWSQCPGSRNQAPGGEDLAETTERRCGSRAFQAPCDDSRHRATYREGSVGRGTGWRREAGNPEVRRPSTRCLGGSGSPRLVRASWQSPTARGCVCSRPRLPLLLPRHGVSPAVSQGWRPSFRFEEEPQISRSPGRCHVMWALTSQIRGDVCFYIKNTVTPVHNVERMIQ